MVARGTCCGCFAAALFFRGLEMVAAGVFPAGAVSGELFVIVDLMQATTGGLSV